MNDEPKHRWFCGNGDCIGSESSREEIEAQARREAHTTCCPGCNHCMETALDVQELYSGEYNRGKREGFRDALERVLVKVETAIRLGNIPLTEVAGAIRALLPPEPQGGQSE